MALCGGRIVRPEIGDAGLRNARARGDVAVCTAPLWPGPPAGPPTCRTSADAVDNSTGLISWLSGLASPGQDWGRRKFHALLSVGS